MSYTIDKHPDGSQTWEHEPTGETGTAPTFEEAMTQIKQHHASTERVLNDIYDALVQQMERVVFVTQSP